MSKRVALVFVEVVFVVEGIGKTVLGADDASHVVAAGLLALVDGALIGLGKWSLVVSDRLLVAVVEVVFVVEGIGKTVLGADDASHVVAAGLLAVVDGALMGAGTWSLVVSDRLLVAVEVVNWSLMVIDSLLDIVDEPEVVAAVDIARVEDTRGGVIVGIEDCTGRVTRGTLGLAVEPSGFIGGVIVGGICAPVDVTDMVVTVEGPLGSLAIGVGCETPMFGVVVVTMGMAEVEGVVCCWVCNVTGIALGFTCTTGVAIVCTMLTVLVVGG